MKRLILILLMSLSTRPLSAEDCGDRAPRPPGIDVGLAVANLIPSRLPNFAGTLPAYGVVASFPWGKDAIELEILYGTSPVTEVKLFEVAYRLNVATSHLDGFALVGAAVLATILAPLTEELMYRVTLQEGLEKFAPGNASIWLTALLFAGVHSVNGRPDALPLFPLALILGYVYRQTHSYVAVFTLHALFNGLTVIMTRVAQPG